MFDTIAAARYLRNRFAGRCADVAHGYLYMYSSGSHLRHKPLSPWRGHHDGSEIPALCRSTSGVAGSIDMVSSRFPIPRATLMAGVAATCRTIPVCS